MTAPAPAHMQAPATAAVPSDAGRALRQALVDAVRRDDLDTARALLERGAEPNRRDVGDGLTVLMIAAGRGNAQMTRLLIDAGADVLTVDAHGGGTALHRAVQRGDLETVRVLVEAGSFIDACAATTGHTPLIDAFWYAWPHIVGYLLEHNAGIQLPTHYGFTLSQHIAYALRVNTRGRNRLLAADALLDDRVAADRRRVDEQRLMAAVLDGDADRARSELAAGAQVDERYPVLNGFNDLHTPLLVAARDGHTEIVRMLIDAGADVNAVEPTFGAVPLHKAVYNGHADITRILVEAPGIDLDFQGATNGYTPLHDSIWHGFEDCARPLVDAGARLDLVAFDGKTPLDLCVEVFGGDHPLTKTITAAASNAAGSKTTASTATAGTATAGTTTAGTTAHAAAGAAT